MTIAVFGANGRVGSLVVNEALARGHKVIAFVHNAAHLTQQTGLTIKQGDVYDADSVDSAIKGADVVISALGSWGTPSKDILAAGMRNIIPAMHRQGISRIISLTGADARATGDHLSLVHRLTHIVFSITAGKVLADGEEHLRLLQATDLDWTVIRSPIMRSAAGLNYSLGTKRPLPTATIPRELVAQCLVDQIEDDTWYQLAPYITR